MWDSSGFPAASAHHHHSACALPVGASFQLGFSEQQKDGAAPHCQQTPACSQDSLLPAPCYISSCLRYITCPIRYLVQPKQKQNQCNEKEIPPLTPFHPSLEMSLSAWRAAGRDSVVPQRTLLPLSRSRGGQWGSLGLWSFYHPLLSEMCTQGTPFPSPQPCVHPTSSWRLQNK